MKSILVITVLYISLFSTTNAQHNTYTWLNSLYDSTQSIHARINPPPGYERIDVVDGSFADWLRKLQLKPDSTKLRFHDGSIKPWQNLHAAIVDIDIGSANLQQCADAIIRLRAEYMLSVDSLQEIYFNYTSGDTCSYLIWRDGYRPRVNGNSVSWHKPAAFDSTYANFRSYLNSVFTFAGTHSLNRELQKVNNPDSIQIGDIFIEAGFPGHALIVVDMVVDTETGEKLFLLAQSFMPAQDVHIVKNFQDSKISPWYNLEKYKAFTIPEGLEFSIDNLKRFK